MKLMKLAALLGAAAFATACDDGTGTDDKSGDTGVDTDTMDSDTDSMDTDDTDMMMACYEDGTGGDAMWDLCEYDDDWKEALTLSCGTNSASIVLRTNNWGYAAEIYMAETRFTKDWDESHDMTNAGDSADADGWSLFQLDLQTDVAFADVDQGKTLFNCADGDIDPADTDNFQVTFAAVVYSDTGATTVADCIVFGHDASGLIGGIGTLPGTPAWLTAGNCSAL